MSADAVKDALNFVVFGKNRWRITIHENENGDIDIVYDAHGQSVSEARRTIRNIVNVSRVPFKLSIIHGYNHGCAIRDMIQSESFNGRVTCRYIPCENVGITHMQISA